MQEGLRNAGAPKLRWVRPEGIHLTLKFLGNVEEHRVPSITDALAKATEAFELTIQPSGVGGFGGRRIRVVWVGLEGDVERLAALATRVDEACGALGFERERRPFAAHLTLARVPDEDFERRAGASGRARQGVRGAAVGIDAGLSREPDAKHPGTRGGPLRAPGIVSENVTWIPVLDEYRPLTAFAGRA